MITNGKKSPRKSKLVPRQEMEEEIKSEMVAIEDMKPEPTEIVDATMTPLQLSIKVEVEQCDTMEIQNDDVTSFFGTEIKEEEEEDSDMKLQMEIYEEEEQLSKLASDPKNLEFLESMLKTQKDDDIENTILSYVIQKKDTYEDLLKKMISNHQSIITESGSDASMYKCELCNRSWFDIREFHDHLRVTHEDDTINILTISHSTYVEVVASKKIFDCKKCDRVFPNELDLKGHHSEKFKCDRCEKTFKSCWNVKMHKCGPAPIACACGSRFAGRKSYETHRLTCIQAHNGQTFKCVVCARVFLKETELETHLVKLHTVRTDQKMQHVKIKVCEHCNQNYVGSKGVHDCPGRVRLRSFCKFCEEGFQTLGLLKVHQKAMKKDGLKCPICKATFQYECAKEKHRCQDYFVMSFECSICKRSYADAEEAHRHLQLEHLVHFSVVQDYVSPAIEKQQRDKAINAPALVTISLEDVKKKDEPIVIKEEAEDEVIKVFQTTATYSKVSKSANDLKVLVNPDPQTAENDSDDDDVLVMDISNEVIEITSDSEQINDEKGKQINDEKGKQINDEKGKQINDEKGKQIRCKICGFSSRRKLYKNHYKKCHDRKELVASRVKYVKIVQNRHDCSTCDRSFDSMSVYYRHFVKHDLQRSQCPYCLVVLDKTHFLPHCYSHVTSNYYKCIAIDKTKTTRTNRSVKCKICKIAVDKAHFLVHYETHSLKNRNQTFVKNEVDKVKSDCTEVPRHLFRKSIDLLTNNLSLAWGATKSCIICLKMFDRRNDLKRHLIEHFYVDAFAQKNRNKGLVCPVCSQMFPKRDTFKFHMREHALLPMYHCTLCNKTFSDSSNFAKHKKVHDISVIFCDVCGKKFTSKKMLIQHIGKHDESAPVECEHCHKKFFFENALKKHINMVHAKRGVPCSHCQQRFLSLKQLWDHAWEQHQERKYQADCMVCGIGFRNYSILKRHMRQSH